VALAEAALARLDEVLLVLPAAFPHKTYDGVPLEQRLRIVRAVADTHPRLAAAVSDGGLITEMARECQEALPESEVSVICGRDAAERFVAWDYGAGPGIAEQLMGFQLLVAPRGGTFQPPRELADRIGLLDLPDDYDQDSASDVRRRLAEGTRWEHLVPAPALDAIRSAYAR
jgi:nicotinic acid mononucleotide adenylyltransferase